ncbi:MAG: hypothetical protein EOM26_02865 [Alphaproteobacteria bacterium]|nr:hypothetical protein [Alphaproteobacteria bacterium]
MANETPAAWQRAKQILADIIRMAGYDCPERAFSDPETETSFNLLGMEFARVIDPDMVRRIPTPQGHTPPTLVAPVKKAKDRLEGQSPDFMQVLKNPWAFGNVLAISLPDLTSREKSEIFPPGRQDTRTLQDIFANQLPTEAFVVMNSGDIVHYPLTAMEALDVSAAHRRKGPFADRKLYTIAELHEGLRVLYQRGQMPNFSHNDALTPDAPALIPS